MLRRIVTLLVSLVLTLSTAACVTDTETISGGALVVISGDGRLSLTVPEEALEGMDINRIKIGIEKIEIESLPKGTKGEPVDAAYSLQPDGLELAAPAQLEFQVPPDQMLVTALHISEGSGDTPNVEFLDLRDPGAIEGRPTAAPSPGTGEGDRVLVTEIDHFSDIPLWTVGSHGFFQLTREQPQTDALTLFVNDTVTVTHKLTRQLSDKKTVFFWPPDRNRFIVKLHIPDDRPWTSHVGVWSEDQAPLSPDHETRKKIVDDTNSVDIEPTTFKCDETGDGGVGAWLELVTQTVVAEIWHLDEKGKVTGKKETRADRVNRSFLSDIGISDPPSVEGPKVTCSDEAAIDEYLTGFDLRSDKFEVHGFNITYDNESTCGAPGTFSYTHSLWFNGFNLKLRQEGYDGVFKGKIDGKGDFKLELDPQTPEKATYEGHLNPDGSASGTFEYTYPQQGCTAEYDFRWRAWVNNMLKGLKGQ